MSKILVVEDDDYLSNMVVDFLRHKNYQVELVSDGNDALHYMRTYKFDLVILDLGLPGLEGTTVLDEVRKAGDQVPILILTGRGTMRDKELGFDLGADDYLTKPFDVRELGSRVKAILRRPRVMAQEIITCGDLQLDTSEHKLTKAGEKIKLSPNEFMLFEFLMRNPNQVFSATTLLDRVWKSDSEATEEAIVTCIRRIRKRIDDPGKESYIRTEYGVGYMLKEPGA